LRRLHDEVLVDARARDDLELRAAAVGLILPPGAALARETAAWLYGVDARPPGEHEHLPDIVCVVPAGARAPIRRRGIRCYQADLANDDVTLTGGVPCTTPLRTCVDLLRYARPFVALAAADSLAGHGLVEVGGLRAEVERWRGQRFTDRARRLAGLVEPATESPGESWLRLRIIDAGFPRPQIQIWVPSKQPGAYRIDLGYPALRKGIEYDGEAYHEAPEQRAHDEIRRRQLWFEHGWSIMNVGRGEVLGPSLALEYAIGEFLGMEPQIVRRAW
jgi:hypothetical protein